MKDIIFHIDVNSAFLSWEAVYRIAHKGGMQDLREIPSAAGEALCKECSSIYNVMREEGKCPMCGSRAKTILGGTEFRLLEIGVSDPSKNCDNQQ